MRSILAILTLVLIIAQLNGCNRDISNRGQAESLIADTSLTQRVEPGGLEYDVWWSQDNRKNGVGWFVKGDSIYYPNLHLAGTFTLKSDSIDIQLPSYPTQTFLIRKRGNDTVIVVGSGMKELQGVFHSLRIDREP